jgi:DNA-binding response OmpR family regulator
MVVDDDRVFRNLLATVLRREYLVSVASHGAEAYRKACEHPPQLLVIDIQMPGWDGLQTLRAFRDHPALAHAGVIVLTSDTSRKTVEAAIRAGADEYVLKSSFSTSEFLLKIGQLRRRLEAGQLRRYAAATGNTTPAPHGAVPLISAASPCNTEAERRLQEVLDSWE